MISKKLFNQKHIYLFPNYNVSTQFVYTEISEHEEILMRWDLILANPEAFFPDIGLNIGFSSICLMDLCSQTFAFEPHTYTATRCEMNFTLNGRTETDVYETALSEKDGFTYFSDFGGSSSINHVVDQESGICVRTQTLDTFVLEHSLSRE